MMKPQDIISRLRLQLLAGLGERPALLSFRGRVGRLDFWLFYASFMLISAVIQTFAMSLMIRLGSAGQAVLSGALLLFICFSMLVFCSFVVRRLRDAGRGLWTVPTLMLSGPSLMVALAIDMGLFAAGAGQGSPGATAPPLPAGPSSSPAGAAFMLSLLVFSISAFLCLRGLMAPAHSQSKVSPDPAATPDR